MRTFPQFTWARRTLARARRRRTPTLLQIEATECGAVALAIVLAHHGRFVSLEALRVMCGVTRDGSKAANIIRAARSYGMLAKGYRKEPAELAALPLPLIVFWNFNHFVVVEGFGADEVFLNDPASGPRIVTSAEFDAAFTGVALVCTPGPEFTRGGSPPGLRSLLGPRLAGTHVALAFVLLASLALVVPGLVIPSLLRVFVDDVLIRDGRGWLQPLLIGLTLAALLRGALTWLQLDALRKLEARIALGGSSQFVWHALQLPVAFFTQRSAGEVAGRVALNGQLARLLSSDLAVGLVNLVLLVFFALLMLRYDPLLTAVGVAAAAGSMLALRLVARQQTDGERRTVQDRSQMLGVAYAGLRMIETFKAGADERELFTRWAGYQAKVVNVAGDLGRVQVGLAVLTPLLAALASAAVLVLGGRRVLAGQLTIGELVAFQSLLASFLQPVGELSRLDGALRAARGAAERIEDVTLHPLDPRLSAAAVPGHTAALGGRLEVAELSFGYNPNDPPLLTNLSLTLEPGRCIALVGGSGSGKSTVARLVSGLYPPWSGAILFDDRPIEAIARATLTAGLALVSQETRLFAGTLRDNLTLWDAAIPDQAIVRALDDAALETLLVGRVGGLDAPLLEGGHNLSGGQRQRLSIARALVRDPAILVLDEATSALDPITERQVLERLRARGCACLVITHRLSAIRDADEIIVLERGQVVARGTHATLSRTPGPYARLIGAEPSV